MALDIDPSEEGKKIVDLDSKRQRPGFSDYTVNLNPEADSRSNSEIDATDSSSSADSKPVDQETLSYPEMQRNAALIRMFSNPVHMNKFLSALDNVDEAEREIYIDTLVAYEKIEPEKLRSMGLATRLENFEKSTEFSESNLKIKLSDVVKKETLSENSEKKRQDTNTLGRADSPTGLSQAEGDAAVNLLGNAAKAAGNVAQGGSNLIGSLSGLAGGAISSTASLVAAPGRAVVSAGKGMYHKMKGDGIPRQEKATQDSIDMKMQSLGENIEKFEKLPKDSPNSVVKPLMETMEKQAKEISGEIRTQSKQGVTNALDDNLSEKQKLLIKSPGEVEESGETNTKKLSGLMDKLSDAPALKGAGNEQLQQKAKEMAADAAEMIRKIIESIRDLFSRGNEAKNAAGQSGPSASAPRM